jgi:hypothetical protein
MGREIRVSIDDDEVFERMKARKRELDLSWEEVLHRGLWTEAGPGPNPTGPHGGHGAGEDFGDRIERQVKRRVEQSLRSAFGSADQGQGSPGAPSPPSPPSAPSAPSHPSGGYESEMESLANAEDAVLRFPFLDDETHRVPLRVDLSTSADGLDVEVVTVRRGKDVEGMNVFDRSARKAIAEGLATGSMPVLELEAGVEEYRVAPALSWSRDDRGRPVVADVEIEEVIFDDDA